MQLTITLDTGLTYSELVEEEREISVPVNWIKRTWLNMRGQTLPTVTVPTLVSVEMPSLYTIHVDEDTDADEFEERIISSLNPKGNNHSIVSLLWETDFGPDAELYTPNQCPTGEELANFVRLMVDGEYASHTPDAYAAAVSEYGWDTGHLSDEWFQDNYRGQWESPEEYVKNLAEDMGAISPDFPDWIDIDWSGTADNMSTDDDYVLFGLDYHVFYRHG
ncbi:hypothetical protein HWB05_gp030 [Streptomyces phage BRock]|uniref:Antirestriction protein n=1 Tax=Streptomyces phage BRock TaxID=1913591 RepID=A0A1J0GVT9_9CAUD|nr:hypothetical protein HWB05_gp030 [Streptomyces phage BRock]APC46292.1 hypothetical protein [Streptomyces phage BRock]